MYNRKIKIFLINLFDEGKYIDFWSIPHVLSGVLAFLGAKLLDVDLWLGFAISFVLMIAWEFFEDFVEIHEFITNRVGDVVTGIIGFWGTYYLFEIGILKVTLWWFWLFLIIFAVIDILGFLSFILENKKLKI